MTAHVAGVDEAGRGPLAGPVVVAAVILDPARPIDGLADSKQLTARRREALYALIVERALTHAVVRVEAAEIDRVNILQATLAGMLEHLQQALVAVDFLDPAAPKQLMPRLQQLFNRAQPSEEEIHILRGVARAMLQTAERAKR